MPIRTHVEALLDPGLRVAGIQIQERSAPASIKDAVAPQIAADVDEQVTPGRELHQIRYFAAGNRSAGSVKKGTSVG
jgi:hypothetical protein